MKKLLCIVCLLAAVLFVDTADACATGRCGGSYYGRSSYSRSYVTHRSGYVRPSSYGHNYGHRSYSRSYGHNYGHRSYGRSYGRHYGHGYRHYGHNYGHRSHGRSYGRGYSRCTSCGYRR